MTLFNNEMTMKCFVNKMACPPIARWAMAGLTLLACGLAGCGELQRGAAAPGYRTVSAEPMRDADAARRLYAEALAPLAEKKLDAARKLLEKALAADVEFGPAHVALGKVYYLQGDWYRAAWEFEYARRLMPRRAEAPNNLGLVYEATGELDRAVESYRQAVALDGREIEYKANLARALVRGGELTRETRSLLAEVAEKDSRREWSHWAAAQLASLKF